MKSRPLAVLISDVHYSVQTLELANKSMLMAIDRANSLFVPLIVAGDLHDTKANMRAECVEAMIYMIKQANLDPIILRGNHDQINEKSTKHSLEFLRPWAIIIDSPEYNDELKLYFIPYQHDKTVAAAYIKAANINFNIVMHQGIQGSHSGDYFQDHSALHPKDVQGRRIISGHYHRRQTIKLPGGGIWDYIGNPYTTNFGEARDPEKGFQILYEDGSLEFVPTNLRKHVVIETDLGAAVPYKLAETDLVKVRVTGTKELLAAISKEQIQSLLGIWPNFKLEFIPADIEYKKDTINEHLSQKEQFDQLIDATSTDKLQKERLKILWKGLV